MTFVEILLLLWHQLDQFKEERLEVCYSSYCILYSALISQSLIFTVFRWSSRIQKNDSFMPIHVRIQPAMEPWNIFSENCMDSYPRSLMSVKWRRCTMYGNLTADRNNVVWPSMHAPHKLIHTCTRSTCSCSITGHAHLVMQLVCRYRVFLRTW